MILVIAFGLRYLTFALYIYIYPYIFIISPIYVHLALSSISIQPYLQSQGTQSYRPRYPKLARTYRPLAFQVCFRLQKVLKILLLLVRLGCCLSAPRHSGRLTGWPTDCETTSLGPQRPHTTRSDPKNAW